MNFRVGVGAWKSKLCTLLLGIVAVATCPNAEAEFLQDFSGNTAPTRLLVTSTVNFAVLNQTDGSGNDPWKTGYANFASTFVPGAGSTQRTLATSKYLYLYQVTDDGRGTNEITRFFQELIVSTDKITSWGYFGGLGLSDRAGLVTSANFFGNTRTRPGGGGQARANVGVDSPSVAPPIAGTFTNPRSIALLTAPDAFDSDWNPGIPFQSRSVLFGFTSDLGPTFAPDQVVAQERGESNNALGMSPTPVPEPSRLAIVGIGLLCTLLRCAIQSTHGRG